MPYATPADYYLLRGLPLPTPFTREEQNRIAALLEASHDELRPTMKTAIYDTDSTGAPSDAHLARELKRAIVTQAAYFDENPRALSEGSREFDNVAFGSMRLGSNSGSDTAKSGKSTRRLSARAVLILQNAGFYSVTGRRY